MNIYTARWNHAKRFFGQIKQLIDSDDECVVVVDGDPIIFTEGDIIIDEEHQEIIISSLYLTLCMYNGDRELGDDANTPIDQWTEEMLTRVRVFKEVKLKK